MSVLQPEPRPVSMIPAAPGWRLNRLDTLTEPPGYWSTPIVAWAICDEVRVNEEGEVADELHPDRRPRWISAVVCGADGPELVDRGVWYYAGPDDPEPTPEAVEEAHRQHAAELERLKTRPTATAEPEPLAPPPELAPPARGPDWQRPPLGRGAA